MTDRLIVIANGHIMGELTCGPNIDLIFTYADEWRASGNNFPLSLSHPLATATHKAKPVEAFLWGLLPDNEFILSQWAKKFQVSPKNPFAMLTHVGGDCAGAVQFVPPNNADDVLLGKGEIDFLSEKEIASRLRALKEDHSATRTPRDTGQFSLAGAQPKTALIYKDGKWGVPSGSIPTTHILKPPTGAFDGYAENEHFCLKLAHKLGLPASHSFVKQFGDEQTIIVERYDRLDQNGKLFRVHQEDFCQALSVPPFQKYQNEGGPGAEACIDLLKRYSMEQAADIDYFTKALVFNWMIGGTDGHAKNYSLLLGSGSRARLAPFYDLSSALPYPDMPFQRLKLAMKVDHCYRIRDISIKQWERLWQNAKYDVELGRMWMAEWCEKLPDLSSDVANGLKNSGLSHPIIPVLHDKISKRAEECKRALSLSIE